MALSRSSLESDLGAVRIESRLSACDFALSAIDGDIDLTLFALEDGSELDALNSLEGVDIFRVFSLDSK